MRYTILFTIICFITFTLFAQEEDSSIDHGSPEELITFTYTILPGEMTDSYFKVSHDTVTFRLVYVDVACHDYEYLFKRNGKSLIVQRMTNDPNNCNEEEEQIYAFKGTMIGVPAGKYLFELESSYGDKKSPLFREVIIVK